jgi:flagellar motor protein MotB
VIVEIEGHCDERGATEYNLALGAKRAQAAKDYLVDLGIDGSRLSIITMEKNCRFARNITRTAGKEIAAIVLSCARPSRGCELYLVKIAR